MNEKTQETNAAIIEATTDLLREIEDTETLRLAFYVIRGLISGSQEK